WRDLAARPWVWLAGGLAGTALALGRPTGPVFVGLDLLVWLGLIGAHGFGQRARRAPVAAAVAALLLAAGIVLNRLWEFAHGSHIATDPAALARQIGPAFARLPVVLREEVGVFGALDTLLPWPATELWMALLAALVAVA